MFPSRLPLVTQVSFTSLSADLFAFLFEDVKILKNQRKCLVGTKKENEEDSPRLNCLTSQKSAQAFFLLTRNSSFNQLVSLSAFFATLLLKMQTHIFAEVASALCFLVACCEKLIR